MIVVVADRDKEYAEDVIRSYGATPVGSVLVVNQQKYWVFEKAPAAALLKIQLEKGVDLNDRT